MLSPSLLPEEENEEIEPKVKRYNFINWSCRRVCSIVNACYIVMSVVQFPASTSIRPDFELNGAPENWGAVLFRQVQPQGPKVMPFTNQWKYWCSTKGTLYAIFSRKIEIFGMRRLVKKFQRSEISPTLTGLEFLFFLIIGVRNIQQVSKLHGMPSFPQAFSWGPKLLYKFFTGVLSLHYLLWQL